MENQKNLELTIRVNHDNFEIDVYEPESGEINQMVFSHSSDERHKFNEALGAEIYSWISLWMDENEDA